MKKLLLASIIGLFAINSFAADATKDPAKADPTAQAAVKKHKKHTIAPMKKEVKKEVKNKPTETETTK